MCSELVDGVTDSCIPELDVRAIIFVAGFLLYYNLLVLANTCSISYQLLLGYRGPGFLSIPLRFVWAKITITC